MAKLDIKEVERLNKLAAEKNAYRQQLIGKRDAAQQAFDRAVSIYSQKYGVALTLDNLQSEYDKVSSEVEKEYNELLKLVTDIENGVYDTAKATKVDEVRSNDTVEFKQSDNGVNSSVGASIFGGNSNTQSVNTGIMGNTGTGNSLVGNGVNSPVGISHMVTGVSMDEAVKDEDISERSVTPGTWGSANLNREFNDIINGVDSNKIEFNI